MTKVLCRGFVDPLAHAARARRRNRRQVGAVPGLYFVVNAPYWAPSAAAGCMPAATWGCDAPSSRPCTPLTCSLGSHLEGPPEPPRRTASAEAQLGVDPPELHHQLVARVAPRADVVRLPG